MNDFNNKFEIFERSISQPKSIKHKYFTPMKNQTDNMDILIVSFLGTYPSGSLGSSYAKYISLMSLHGLQYFEPECLILDFRELDYQYGNSLMGVFQDISIFKDANKEENEPFFPVLVVTSDKCKDGFLSLVTQNGQAEPSFHFSDLSKAIDRGVTLGRQWLDY